MEQLVARRAHNPKVVGSSPAPATKVRVSVSVNTHLRYESQSECVDAHSVFSSLLTRTPTPLSRLPSICLISKTWRFTKKQKLLILLSEGRF